MTEPAAEVALARRLEELERMVDRWEYPERVRLAWDEAARPDDARAFAARNLAAVRANMHEGIELARGFLAAGNARAAMGCVERLVARWERWLRQVSVQDREAAQALRTWFERWDDELTEWTRAARAAVSEAADELEGFGRMGLVFGALAVLVYLGRR